MADETAWLKTLPRKLQQRFDGLGKYVRAVLEEVNLRDKLTRDAVERIHVLVFVRALDELLREGTNAAIAAVDALSALGVDSFKVGQERFSGRNDAVMRGESLSNRLRDVTATSVDLRSSFESPYGMRQMIIKLGKELASNGRRMDRNR
jgi:hypothetical protein